VKSEKGCLLDAVSLPDCVKQTGQKLNDLNILINNILCNLPAAGRIGVFEFWWQIFFFSFYKQAQSLKFQVKSKINDGNKKTGQVNRSLAATLPGWSGKYPLLS
jgi:hypothetical protein